MLKTIESIGSIANPKKTKGRISVNSEVSDMVDSDEAINPIKRKNLVKTTKSKISVKSKNHDFPKFRLEKVGTSFFTPEARLAFT